MGAARSSNTRIRSIPWSPNSLEVAGLCAEHHVSVGHWYTQVQEEEASCVMQSHPGVSQVFQKQLDAAYRLRAVFEELSGDSQMASDRVGSKNGKGTIQTKRYDIYVLSSTQKKGDKNRQLIQGSVCTDSHSHGVCSSFFDLLRCTSTTYSMLNFSHTLQCSEGIGASLGFTGLQQTETFECMQ